MCLTIFYRGACKFYISDFFFRKDYYCERYDNRQRFYGWTDLCLKENCNPLRWSDSLSDQVKPELWTEWQKINHQQSSREYQVLSVRLSDHLHIIYKIMLHHSLHIDISWLRQLYNLQKNFLFKLCLPHSSASLTSKL